MDFLESIHDLANKATKIRDSLETEEATKNALVMPFIRLLGYDVFNPEELVPEFTADVVGKKGEKVDYAVIKDGEPAILFECKCCDSPLEQNQANQLYRYFTATSARIGVLTDGIVYKFFTDLDQANIMDNNPFMVFDLSTVDESLVQELKKLSKERFDIEATISSASELKYSRAIKKYLQSELSSPTDDFVKFFASQVYSGRLMAGVVEQFKDIVPSAFRGFINDELNDRLKSLMTSDVKQEQEEQATPAPVEKNGIVTTEEEIEGYNIVRAIVSEVCDVNRVHMRDTKSYCGILLDDNNRKPICRLHFNANTKYIGVFDDNRHEERVPIAGLTDIFQYGDRIKQTISAYDA